PPRAGRPPTRSARARMRPAGSRAPSARPLLRRLVRPVLEPPAAALATAAQRLVVLGARGSDGIGGRGARRRLRRRLGRTPDPAEQAARPGRHRRLLTRVL